MAFYPEELVSRYGFQKITVLDDAAEILSRVKNISNRGDLPPNSVQVSLKIQLA